MATPFNLVAQLQLSGPTNLGPVVRRVQAALNNVSANVNITLGRGAISNLTKANVQLKDMSAHLSAIAMNASKAEASIRSMVASLNSVKTGGAATGAINVNMKNASHAIKQATNEMEEFGRVSALAVRRFLAFSIPAGLLVSTVTGIKGAVSAAVDYNREFVRLQQITSASAASIKNISNEVTRLATSMGTSSAELIKVSNTLAAAGLTAKQTKIALESLAQTQLSSQFEDIENTVDGAIAAMQQFKIPVEDLNKTLASVTAVSREFAAESRDIVIAIQHAGGAFKSAGGNIEELMALFTAIRSTTRESAESIATGLRTIMTRIERPRTIEYMRQLGIELQDIKGKFVGPYEAIRRMGEALRGLDSRDVRYAQIVEELGGYRQVSKVIPALQETAAMQRALMVAQSGSNALAQEAAIAQEALSVKLTKVKEAWLALGRDVVESKGFKIMAESAMAFATALTQVLRALQPIIPMLTTLAAIKGIQAVASFAPGFAKGLKFARGGVVPGTGDRDTVPAMLQPGEFVLRKSAVKAIGTDALHSANRFAGGGLVNQNKVGIASLYDIGDNKSIQISKSNFTEPAVKKQIPFTKKNYEVVIGDVDEDIRKKMVKAMSTSIRKTANTITGVLSGPPIKKSTWDNVKNNIQYNTIAGLMWENAINSLRTSGNVMKEDASRPFDFVGGLGGASNIFPKLDGINYIDAKAIKKYDKKDITKKIINQIRDELSPKAETWDTLPEQEREARRVRLTNLEQRNLASGKMTRAMATKLGVIWEKKASGGSISGSDSVPALLTPGEFVFNKDAVNRIGVGNLHKMNKYASGGVVKMATGGTPPANAGSFAGTSMFGIMGISTLAQSFFGLESSIGKTIQKFTEFAITIEGARMAMGMLQGMAQTAKGGIGGMFSGGIGANGRYFSHAFSGTNYFGSRMGLGGRAAYLHQGMMASGGYSALTNAGSALAAGGLLYGASMKDKEAERLVQLSGGDFSKIRGAENAAKSSNMMSAAGMGVGAGAAIGTVFGGPLGTLAGAAIGGGIGALIGALRDNTSEVRSNTASLATQKATEGFSEAFSRISSGSSFNVAGDTQKAISELSKLFNVVKNSETIPDKALRDKNVDEAYRSIKGQGVAFNELLKPMLQGIKSVTELDKNKNAQLLIRGMAVAGGVGVNQAKERVQKDIDALNANTEMLKKNAEALLKVENTLGLLDKFAAYTSMSAEQNAAAFERASMLGGGGPVLPSESNAINNISRNPFINRDELNSRLGTMFAGAGEYGGQMQGDAMQLFDIMRDLPEILRRAAIETDIKQEGTIDIQNYIEDALRGNKSYGTSPVIDAIVSNLGGVISSNRQGGDVEVRQGIINDANKIADMLTGEYGEKFKSGLNEIQKSMVDAAKRFATGIDQYNAKMLESHNRYVEKVRMMHDNESKMIQLRANLTGNEVSYNTLTKPYYAQQAAMVRDLGVGDGTNMGALDAARRERLDRMAKLETDKLGTAGSKDVEEFGKLKREVTMLENAMQHLANTTELVSAAQQKLQEATEARQTKNRFATDYVFSPFEDKMKTIRSIQTIGDMNAGRTDARRLMMAPELLSGVKNIAETYRNVRLPALFGTRNGENGEMIGLSGAEWIDKVSKQYFSQVKMPPGMQGLGELFSAQASAVQVSPEEQVYLDKIAEINNKQIEALGFLESWPKDAATEMYNSMKKALNEFNAEFPEKIKALFISIKEESLGTKESSLALKQGDIRTATSIHRQILPFLPTLFSRTQPGNPSIEASMRVARSLDSNVQNIGIYRNLTKFNEDINNNTIKKIAPMSHLYGNVPQERIESILSEFFSKEMLRGLVDSGYNEEEIRKIRNSFTENGSAGYEDLKLAVNEIKSNISARASSLRGNMMDAAGLDRRNFDEIKEFHELINNINIGNITDSLIKLTDKNIDISATAKAIDELTNSIAVLKAEIEGMKRGPVAPAAGGMASGGSIFKPRGTDTVPAMLTPGEFVVRREQAQKHRALLESINDGTVYAAAGGYIPYRERQEKIKADRAAARARHENEMSRRRGEQEARASAYRNRFENDRGIGDSSSPLTNRQRRLLENYNMIKERKKEAWAKDTLYQDRMGGTDIFGRHDTSLSKAARNWEKRESYIKEVLRKNGVDPDTGAIIPIAAAAPAPLPAAKPNIAGGRRPRPEAGAFWWETPAQTRRRERDAGQSPWMQRIDARVSGVTQFSGQAKEQLLRRAWATGEVPPEVRGTPFEAEVLNMLAKRVTPEQTKENLDAYNAAVGVRRGLDIVNAPAADVIAANASVGLWESRTQEDFSTASRQRNYNLPPIDRTREPAVLPNGFRRRPVGRGSAYNTRMEPVAGDRRPDYFGIAGNSLQELRDLYSNERKKTLAELREERNRRTGRGFMTRGFNSGGYVDNIPAYLSQGEFVMSASATGRIGVNNLKRMNAGGHVNYMADGGTAPAASGVASELALSSAAMTAMETLSNSMVNASTIIQSSVDPLRAAFAQFDGSAKLVFDAASAFNTAIQSFSTSIAGLPKEIGVKINNVEALTAQTTNINAALTQFTQGMSSTLGQLNSIMDNINKASTILNGLVGSLKDKLQITVTVTHSPIVVKVEGTKMTATGDTKISDIAINSVKEIDNFKKRLDTFGDIA